MLSVAVDAISQREGEDYKDYLQRVIINELAKVVKIADINHNLARSRASSISAKDAKAKKRAENRVSKYNRGLDFLIPERVATTKSMIE